MADFGIPIDVLVKDSAWANIIKDADKFCQNVIDAAKSGIEFYLQGEVSIALVSNAEIQGLNKTYRGKDTPTNVLSFPDPGPAPLLGDIVIARETILCEAEAANIPVLDHLAHMLVHGFLHLQEYDHENDKDAAIMEALEVKALRALNIDNPYKNDKFA